MEVVAEAADGRQAVALAAEHRPDIALVDIQMPVLDGLGATRQIVGDERLDSVRVVILTNFGLDEYIFAALRAGASGFLLKDTQPAELLQALRVVMRGDALLSPAVTRRLISEFVARPPDAVAAAGICSWSMGLQRLIRVSRRPGHAGTRCLAYRRGRPGRPGQPGRTRPWSAPSGTQYSGGRWPP